MSADAATADKIAIVELLSRYHHAVDAKDWDAFPSLMLDDAAAEYAALGEIELFGLEGRYEGLAAIVDWIRVGQEPFQFGGAPTHFMTNHVVTVSGDVARSKSSFMDVDLVHRAGDWHRLLPLRPPAHRRGLAHRRTEARAEVVRRGPGDDRRATRGRRTRLEHLGVKRFEPRLRRQQMRDALRHQAVQVGNPPRVETLEPDRRDVDCIGR